MGSTFLNLFLLCYFFNSLFCANGYRILGFSNEPSELGITPATSTDISNPGDDCNCAEIQAKCVALIQCPSHVSFSPKSPSCRLKGGSTGICCLSGQNHTISKENARAKNLAASPEILRSVTEEARSSLTTILQQRTHTIQRGHPEFIHNMMFRSSPRDMLRMIDLSNRAMEQILASRIYKEKEHISNEDFQSNLLKIRLDGTALGRNCLPIPTCSDTQSKYRNPDGTCNNPLPHRSLWGAAGQPMERLLPPAYEDGIWSARQHSVDGSPLTSPRAISRHLLPDVNRPHPRYNLLLMQFGQFISHDFTQSASITQSDGQAIQCCSDDGSEVLTTSASHFACMPISIEQDDEFYRMFNQGCINFVRSSLAPHFDCCLGYGKQLSKVTHYLDGSAIYGSDLATQQEVRSFRDGKLRMFSDYGRDLLPLTNDPDACASVESGNSCFLAGDGRANQIISLTALHVLFAREHNRIAEILGNLNPHFTDDWIFNEAKRVVCAEIQHITYNEWLPLVVGIENMKRFGLETRLTGYATDYDPEVNAAITNEFSGAAFRFGHSTVDGKFRIHRDNDVDEIIDIPDVMFNPSKLRSRDYLDNLLRMLTEQPMQQVDNSITYGLSRFLFRAGNPFGLDLASLNIQRGRDHGIRNYNDYLNLIGSPKIQNFNEFGPEVASRLSRVYKHPDDIDLWIGGLIEPAVGDALVGLTFGEIISDQFSRFKRGDRYFYDNHPSINPGHFSPEQLHEIRKSSMARIICDNADHYTLNKVAAYAFIRSDVIGNSPLSCDGQSIPVVNLDLWRE